jgi:Fe-S-cluster-containing dehydrogenase component
MKLTRRYLLHYAVPAAATMVAAGSAVECVAQKAGRSDDEPGVSAGAFAMLYDGTRCIGCHACVSACARENDHTDGGLVISSSGSDGLKSTLGRTSINLYRAPDGKTHSFVKKQCMHCGDPACVASCMFKALRKEPGSGIVTWDPSRCVGCRYCEIVCPFHVLRFEWSAFNPRVIKCQFCQQRTEHGEEPACTSVCPEHAIVFGQRGTLLAEAKSRIVANPGKYYENRVYGEHEGGGTQVLYLAAVPFAQLALPSLSKEPIPSKYLKWQKRVYNYLLFPAVLYAAIVLVVRKRWKEHRIALEKLEEHSSLRSQL